MSETPGTWAAGVSQHRNLSIYKVIEQVILPEVEEKFRSKNTPYRSKIHESYNIDAQMSPGVSKSMGK